MHKLPFEEHKLILSIFDSSHGMIKAIARRPSKKKALCYEPFTTLALQIRPSGHLATVQSAEPIPSQYLPPLQGNHLWAGLYCNELLYRLCQVSEHYPQTYTHYQKLIRVLSQGCVIRPEVRQFEYTLLQDIGYSIDFSCLDSAAEWFSYCADHGLHACHAIDTQRHSRFAVEKLAEKNYAHADTLALMKHIFQQSIRHILGSSALHVTQMLSA